MADLVYGLLGLFINSGVPQDLACISANTQEGTQSPIWELLKYHCVSLSAKLQLPPAELGEVVLTPCRQGLAFFWYYWVFSYSGSGKRKLHCHSEGWFTTPVALWLICPCGWLGWHPWGAAALQCQCCSCKSKACGQLWGGGVILTIK